MYGRWFSIIAGGIFALLLVMAAALTAWTPLFALAIFALVGGVLWFVAAARRTAEQPGVETHRGSPEGYAAPAGGEGATPSSEEEEQGQEAPEPREPASTGMWGEPK